LQFLLDREGRMPYADFTREFGQIRELGPARRDREQPWHQPISPTEMLWYHAFIGRAFLDTQSGPQEYVYVPDELARLLGSSRTETTTPPGGETSTPAFVTNASTAIVDDATALLAWYRREPSGATVSAYLNSQPEKGHIEIPEAIRLLESLLRDMGLLKAGTFQVEPESTRSFLSLERGAALGMLIQAWQRSVHWNDLAALPDLRTSKEGWPNDPFQSRSAILGFLEHVPVGAWWDLTSTIDDIRRSAPAFQRPAGNFDSWYLQDREDRMLNGLESWERVEGALLRYIFLDVLHWLGVADLGREAPGKAVHTFRLSPAAGILFDRTDDLQIREPEGRIEIDGSGIVSIPRGAPRTFRYQIARFAEWIDSKNDRYRYAITPDGLKLASEQGLQVRQIKVLLVESGANVPPSLLAALERWEEHGLEAHMEQTWVLYTETEALMQELRGLRGTKRYLKHILGPKSATVAVRDIPRLLAEAARAGILISASELDFGTKIRE
jgi:hypothetical protein